METLAARRLTKQPTIVRIYQPCGYYIKLIIVLYYFLLQSLDVYYNAIIL